MVAELDFHTYSQVSESWERVRRVKGYREKIGARVFLKFFTRVPEAMSVFGLEGDAIDCVHNDSFLSHARRFVSMFEKAVDMLGPEIDMLTDIMVDLGKKHIQYGVKKEYFPHMGIALIDALRDVDTHFDRETELCWKKVYTALATDMSIGQTE